MGPLTDFASAVDPKPKAPDAKRKGADREQQDQQAGGSSADRRQLAAAVKTSVQKLAAQQPAQRATGQQVSGLFAALLCNALQTLYADLQSYTKLHFCFRDDTSAHI